MSLWTNIDSSGLTGTCGFWSVELSKHGDLDSKVHLDPSLCYIDVMCACKWCTCSFTLGFTKLLWIFCPKCDLGERMSFEWVGTPKANQLLIKDLKVNMQRREVRETPLIRKMSSLNWAKNVLPCPVMSFLSNRSKKQRNRQLESWKSLWSGFATTWWEEISERSRGWEYHLQIA